MAASEIGQVVGSEERSGMSSRGEVGGGILDVSIVDLTRRGRIWVARERKCGTAGGPGLGPGRGSKLGQAFNHNGDHYGNNAATAAEEEADGYGSWGSWVIIPSALEMLAVAGYWREVMTIFSLSGAEGDRVRVGVDALAGVISSSLSSPLAAAYSSVHTTTTSLVPLPTQGIEATECLFSVGHHDESEGSIRDDHRSSSMSIPSRGNHPPTDKNTLNNHNHNNHNDHTMGKARRISKDGVTVAEKCHMLLHCAATDQRDDVFGTIIKFFFFLICIFL